MRRTALLTVTSLIATTAASALVAAPSDARPTPKPRLTAAAVTVAENAGKAVVSLTLSKKARKTVKVAWTTKDGTAVAGSDYTKSAGIVRIKKGKRAGTITVPVLDDVVHEATETFSIALSSKQATGVRAVTVTIGDNDAATPPAPPAPPAPTAPSALVGTITVSATNAFPSGPTTLTMNVHLVPTGTAGEWRDNGTGTWTMLGTLTGIGGACIAFPTTTTLTGGGGFLTGAGTALTNQAALLLSGFDAVGGTGTPSLTWAGVSAASTLMWLPDPSLPGLCIPGGSVPVDVPFALAAPGAPAAYTGTPGVGRGLSFTTAPAGITSITGTLTPVP